MIIKFLGILDILSAVFFWAFAFFKIFPESLVMLSALYLITKGIVFIISEHFISALDVASGLIVFSSLYLTLPSIVIILVSLFILQKGIFSLF